MGEAWPRVGDFGAVIKHNKKAELLSLGQDLVYLAYMK